MMFVEKMLFVIGYYEEFSKVKKVGVCMLYFNDFFLFFSYFVDEGLCLKIKDFSLWCLVNFF